MTDLWSWTASLIKRKASIRPAPASDARSAAGRPASTTAGLVAAATRGTLLTREECARRASTTGPQLNALLAADGRRIPTGMRSYELQTRSASTEWTEIEPFVYA
jgi:hypothetical protein